MNMNIIILERGQPRPEMEVNKQLNVEQHENTLTIVKDEQGL